MQPAAASSGRPPALALPGTAAAAAASSRADLHLKRELCHTRWVMLVSAAVMICSKVNRWINTRAFHSTPKVRYTAIIGRLDSQHGTITASCQIFRLNGCSVNGV